MGSNHKNSKAAIPMKRAATSLTTTLGALGLSLAAMSVAAAVPPAAEVASAATPAEHETIARSYYAEARALEEMAARHRRLAKIYGAAGATSWQLAQARECRSAAGDLKAAAREIRELASAQLQAARAGR